MRQHKILTRTLLLLSIITFALAAPVAVRKIPEVLLDANVTRNVTAALQKRWDPEEGELPLPNVPVPGPHIRPPSSPDLTEILSQIPEQHMYTDNSHPPPDIPGSSTGPRLPVGSMPVAGSLSPPPESWSPNVLGPNHEPPPWSNKFDPLPPSTPPQWSNKFDSLPPSAPQRWSKKVSTPPPSTPPPSTPPQWSKKAGPLPPSTPPQWSKKVGPLPPSAPPPWSRRPPPGAQLQNPGLTDLSQRVRILLGPPPSARPPNQAPDETDLYQKVRISLGLDQPPLRAPPPSSDSTEWSQKVPPSQAPSAESTGSRLPVGSMPVASSLSPQAPPPPPPHPSQPEPHLTDSEFWDNLIKGRIKRRMSDSDAVNLAQQDPRFLKFSRRRHHDADIPHDPPETRPAP